MIRVAVPEFETVRHAASINPTKVSSLEWLANSINSSSDERERQMYS